MNLETKIKNCILIGASLLNLNSCFIIKSVFDVSPYGELDQGNNKQKEISKEELEKQKSRREEYLSDCNARQFRCNYDCQKSYNQSNCIYLSMSRLIYFIIFYRIIINFSF